MRLTGGFKIPNQIQPRVRRLADQAVVARMVSRTYRDSNGNLYVRYLNWNGKQWNWNYNRLDNDWNSNNPAAVLATFFFSRQFILLASFLFVISAASLLVDDQFQPAVQID